MGAMAIRCPAVCDCVGDADNNLGVCERKERCGVSIVFMALLAAVCVCVLWDSLNEPRR